MGEEENGTAATNNNNTNQSDKINAWGNLFGSILMGGAEVTKAVSGAVNNNGQSTTENAPTTQNTPTTTTSKPNWMLFGGIGLAVLIIGFLIFSKPKNNGGSNSSSAEV